MVVVLAVETGIKIGFCSITFRSLDLTGIVSAAERAGLEGVEWGGDVHVPPGDVAAAEKARRLSVDAGITVASYGSYFRCDREPVEPVLDSAEALGAPFVRVWAGSSPKASDDFDPRREVPDVTRHRDLWERTADSLATAATLAAKRSITLCLEHHPHTLTANADGAMRLIDLVREREPTADVRCYWQPNQFFEDDIARSADLAVVLPLLTHMHVFHWSLGENGEPDRRPLAEGEAQWRSWLATADADGPALDAPGRFALLEFVRGDDVGQLVEDAATLRRLVNAATA